MLISLRLVAQPMTDGVPAGYISLSKATMRLSAGMFGGKRHPELGEDVTGSLGLKANYGPRLEVSRQKIYTAITKGLLQVVTFHVLEPDNLSGDAIVRRLVVAPSILKRLIKYRGGLLDRPRHFPLGYASDAGYLPGMTPALTSTGLLVELQTFERWYKRERGQGRWPSQTDRKKRGPGRPPYKCAHELTTAIQARMNDGRWTGQQGIEALHRSLQTTLGKGTPSPDTLGRVLRGMSIVSGDPRLRLKVRRKPSQPRKTT